MQQLDFSKLTGIAYRDCPTAEARDSRDELVEKGFKILEGEKTPFDEQEKPMHQPQPAARKNKLTPLLSLDGSRDYRSFYRHACNFHERHNPPRLSDEYWEEVTDDMCRIAAEEMKDDPFGMALLMDVFEELEREYKALREASENGLRSLLKAAEGQG